MAKCRRNNVGSVILDHRKSIWTSFSGSVFRRKILDAVSCGGSSRYRDYKEEDREMVAKSPKKETERSANATAIMDVPIRKPAETATIHAKAKRKGVKSEKLSDLLGMAEEKNEVETRRKEEELANLKGVVMELQCEDEAKRRGAACNVRLLVKENSEARATLAMLGAIPPLVGLLDLEDIDAQIASLYALLNLCIGNDANKAAIIKAGAIHKMVKLIESPNAQNPSIAEAISANFLCLSALDANKPVIGSSGAIPFLVNTLKNFDSKSSSSQARQDALRALYNLSLFASNVSLIVETDLVSFLINTLGDMEVSERLLSILSNIVSTQDGRKAISSVPDSFAILVDVLNWTDSPACQEKVSYVLMVMAHKAYGVRHSMIEAGIMSMLLELTLLGTTLAQKRASRILECLRVDKGKQVSESYVANKSAAVSAPICGSSSKSSSSYMNANSGSKECVENYDDMSEEKKAVKNLVQQSLQNNMRRIAKRANLPQDFVPSQQFKSLTASCTSKSLPF